MDKPRIASIELTRAIGMLAVICLHTDLFHGLTDQGKYFDYLYYVINNVCRFAVPFYFITSGYYYGKKMQAASASNSNHPLWAYLKRLSYPFLVWLLVYSLLPKSFHLKTIAKNFLHYDYASWLSKQPLDALRHLSESPLIYLLNGGTSSPLWFFPALILSLIFITVLNRFKKEMYLLPIAMVVYAYGLVSKPGYGDTLLGFRLPFTQNIRSDVYMSLLFVSLGCWMARKESLRPQVWQSIGMICGGFIVQEIEAAYLLINYHAEPVFGYLIGTVSYGLGVFLLAISKPNLGKSTIWLKIAPLTMGVYVVHSIFLIHVPAISYLFSDIQWQFIYPSLVFLLSVFLVINLRRCASFRAFVE